MQKTPTFDIKFTYKLTNHILKIFFVEKHWFARKSYSVSCLSVFLAITPLYLTTSWAETRNWSMSLTIIGMFPWWFQMKENRLHQSCILDLLNPPWLLMNRLNILWTSLMGSIGLWARKIYVPPLNQRKRPKTLCFQPEKQIFVRVNGTSFTF